VSSRFGHAFAITTFGESHGGGVGVVVDGCPPRLPLDVAEIQRDLDRRRPGQSSLTTPRQEEDRVEILSGVFEGVTLGTPIGLLVRNQDARPSAYEHMKDVYRPSHADFTTEQKYGVRNWQGGGRASARETVGRVAAGAIARKLLATACGVEVLAWVHRVRDVEAKIDSGTVTLADVESNPVRCPDPAGRGGDGVPDRRRARARRFARRRRRVRRAARTGRTRRARVRQARGRPRARADVAARVEGASRSAAASPARA
jgi:chorismate synthase